MGVEIGFESAAVLGMPHFLFGGSSFFGWFENIASALLRASLIAPTST